jgi:Cft2 family RNA processing exonuclease
MPGVTVQVVGAGDAFGNGGRFQACISVRAPEGHALLDCGATSLVAMKRLGIDPGTVDVVLVTHLHGDHFGGLPFLLLDGQFSRRTRPLVAAGPPGLAERLPRTMEALYPGSSTVERRFTVEVVELPERIETPVGPFRATGYPVDHASGAPSYALRLLAGGTTVACSGDTGWTDALPEAAADPPGPGPARPTRRPGRRSGRGRAGADPLNAWSGEWHGECIALPRNGTHRRVA